MRYALTRQLALDDVLVDLAVAAPAKPLHERRAGNELITLVQARALSHVVLPDMSNTTLDGPDLLYLMMLCEQHGVTIHVVTLDRTIPQRS